MQATEKQIRANVQYTLQTYRSNVQFVDQLVFFNAFSGIISAIKPAPPSPQSYVRQSSPIKTTFSRMTAQNREELLSETTDHTQDDGEDEDDDDDDDDDEELSDDESENEMDMTPPTSTSAHHARSNRTLSLHQPFVMGHKRSLFASIQLDTDRPARKRIIKAEPSWHAERSASSHSAPRALTEPVTEDDQEHIAVSSGSSSSSTAAPAPLVLLHPPMVDTTSQPSVQDLTSTPTSRSMQTPPTKSPSRLSVSATRRAKSKAMEERHKMNLLTVNNTMMSFKKTSHKTIIDSGASTSGTGQRNKLSDLRPTSCSVSAAFGESAQPTEMGLLPPFMLKTIVIDQMNDTTLLSVSQVCAKGFVGIFTAKECKFFDARDVIPHLQDITQNSTPVMSGKIEEGLYLLDSN
jgi:hypothetical protein